ncbi:MAG: hypothetical protein A3K46_08170 [Chloroflexi bacterium RBG_13_60_9]|nr:MAG: hypothetical protein A3K46_08170 [Chloroflexi bacterium RBG_13_60_9]
MKKPALLIISVVLLFAIMACSIGGVAATATPQPTQTPMPTDTEIPPTPTATSTTKPANTPKPTDVPMVTLREFERAFRDAGFTAYAFSDGTGNIWVLDNVFENMYTYDSGWVEIEVLNSLKTRLDHMEQRFEVMDDLFPADFMDLLREANEDYAGTVGAGVTGKAVDPYGPNAGDFWKYQSAYYNVSEETIAGYDVRFALFFQQWTCPPEYICTFPSFGNQEFSGQASFVFYEVAFGLDV